MRVMVQMRGVGDTSRLFLSNRHCALRLCEVKKCAWKTPEISCVQRLQEFRFSLSLLWEGFSILL